MAQWVFRNMPARFKVENLFEVTPLLGQLAVIISQRVFFVSIDTVFHRLGLCKKILRLGKYLSNQRLLAMTFQKKKSMVFASAC